MTDFKRSTEAQGLEIYPDKPKILTNQNSNRWKETEIDGIHVEILPPEGKVKNLGQMITIMDQETTEVQHEIRCVWSAVARHRQEFTSKSYLLRRGLLLRTIQPINTWSRPTSVLYFIETAARSCR